MPQVTLNYSLDLGALGQRQVRVEAHVLTALSGKLMLDLDRVLINAHGRDVDLLPFIGERTRDAMCESLRHEYWAQMSQQVRDAQEAGA